LNVSHTGDISTTSISLSDAYLVPKLSLNLISVGQLYELGYEVYFSERGCIVQEPRMSKILRTGCKVGRLFGLVSLTVPSKAIAHCGVVSSAKLWHSHLGHICSSRLHPLISCGLLGAIEVNKVDCQSCQLAKFHALPFNNNDSIS